MDPWTEQFDGVILTILFLFCYGIFWLIAGIGDDEFWDDFWK